jgi:DNA (cytosine-5)-methyltransferase 1
MKAIDLFAGWGGATEGARQAGVHVVWAANHSPVAVRVHAANHPETEHVCQDLHQANWSLLPDFDLLWASPACQGQSSASQPNRRPYHDAVRATAFAVLGCADTCEPKALIVENVLKFTEWRLYPEWRASLERIGYTLSTHVISATSHGVPQRRDRLFIVGLLNGKTIRAPFSLATEPAFGPCLETNADGWRPVSEATHKGHGKESARDRIEHALKRYPRCLVQHVTGHSGIPLTEAIRTITTKDQWVLADRRRGYRPLTMREIARAQGFPESFIWPTELSRQVVHRGFGNAVPPPVARDLINTVCEAM